MVGYSWTGICEFGHGEIPYFKENADLVCYFNHDHDYLVRFCGGSELFFYFFLFLNYIAATRYDHYSDVQLITGGGRPHTYEYRNIRKYG